MQIAKPLEENDYDTMDSERDRVQFHQFKLQEPRCWTKRRKTDWPLSIPRFSGAGWKPDETAAIRSRSFVGIGTKGILFASGNKGDLVPGGVTNATAIFA